MNIEEKTKTHDGNYKAYTELINRLEDVKNAITKQNYGIAMDMLCKPYPDFQITTHSELKESDDSKDERIRKELIKLLRNLFNNYSYFIKDPFYTECIAWLEKQGKNNMGISKSTKQELEDNINKALEKETPESCNKFLDEQDEQKPTPKFRVGDKIWHKIYKGECMHHIIRIENNNYIGDDNTSISILTADKEYELVEKQGEQTTDKFKPKFKVKYAGNEYNVLEVKDIAGVTFYGIKDEPNHIDYVKPENCEIISGYGIKENGSPYPTKPAVFSEQKPAWSEGDEKFINEIEASLLAYKIIVMDNDRKLANHIEEEINWLKSLRPQQKQEWSKEDKENLSDLWDILAIQRSVNPKVDELMQWVKHLISQQKQEWSKDDITRINEIIETLNIVQANRVRTQRMHYSKATIDKNIDWLKSIKERVQLKQKWSGLVQK